MTWPTPFKPVSSASAWGRSPHCPGVGWIRIGRPMASTAACSLVVSPPRDRPIAAASAPLLRPPHRRAPSRWCCRSGRIRSPACRPGYGKAVPIHRHATTAGTAHAPLSTCRTPPAGHASVPHCRPSTGSHPQTAGCRHRSALASPPDPEDDPQSDPIARPSAFVCSRLGSFTSLESDRSSKWNPLNADTA